MIESKEIRIGNWVLEDGKPVEVDAFDYYDNLMVEDSTYDDGYRKIKEPEGLPLTTKWLLRFGFEKYNDITYTIPIKDFGLQKLVITVDGEYLIVSLADYHSTNESIMLLPERIQYVHQLQNIIFALTFKELKLAK